MKKNHRSNVISIRPPPHVELACGFNGVKATKPRLYGNVEVRSPAGVPIAIVYISLGLFCHEHTSYVSSSSLVGATQKQTKTTTVGKELLLWQAARNSQDILSMDIPFMIAFPTDGDRVLSATHVHPSRSTTYELVATLHSTQFASERFAIEVIVERFDTLPAWGMFAVLQTIRAPSSDHIVDMTVSVPRTCIGPLDTFSASVTISGNPDWLAKVKKVKLDKIVITIDQIVTYKVENSFDPCIKTKRIAESSTSMAGVKIFENPVTQIVSLRFPAKDLRDKSGFLDKQASISSASAAFTTKCALYSVEFQATIRATFKGARDTVATQPIVVSQYTLKNSETILENIEASVYENADLALVTGVCGEISIDASRKSPGDGSPNSRRRTLLME